MRFHPVLLAGLLVLSAGCSGIAGLGSDPAESVTPAPVPEATTGSEQRPAPPPGIGDGGIERVETLAASHQTALWNQSYTFYERYERQRETPNGTVTLVRNETTLVAGPQRYLHRLHRQRYRGSETLSRYEQTAFADGERWYERRDDGTVTETSGTLRFTEDKFASEAAFYVARYVTVTESRTRRTRWDGREYFRVTGTDGTPPSGRDVDAYTVSLVVDSDGLIHRLDVRYRTGTRTVWYSFWYERVGQTSVPTPGWVGADGG
ncbi:hypothetical protein EGH21_00570 [Halomicroarcula sp. F13]|uniref:Lipoprotein n=1 Tax=Haloarcula rubra TaxID=2487747 RepID=A0AAW4PL89_9EURY|nr:hypothetical protein [Halomicroarcula rubra]MBX0321511.1 hypothetical protein [Halomicroarcula rubra]